MLAMGFTAPKGPSGVLRAIYRCLCESGSKTVQAISGYGAQRGRVVPAESIMGSGRPHGRCAPVGSTSKQSTRTPMYMSTGQRHSSRSAHPDSTPSDAPPQDAAVTQEEGVWRARRKSIEPVARPGRWPAASGSSHGSHFPKTLQFPGTS